MLEPLSDKQIIPEELRHKQWLQACSSLVGRPRIDILDLLRHK